MHNPSPSSLPPCPVPGFPAKATSTAAQLSPDAMTTICRLQGVPSHACLCADQHVHSLSQGWPWSPAINGLIVSCRINLELGAAEMKGNSGSRGIADGDGHSPRSVGVALEAGNAEIKFLARRHGLHADDLEARIGGPP